MAGSQFANQYRYMLDAWHPVRNPNSDIPRAGAKSDAALPSDFMIPDASYLRLKNVTLAYTFDLRKKCSWLRDLTLSVSGENTLSVEEIQRIRPRRIERRHLVDAAPHGLGRLPQTPNHHIQHPVEILNQ